MAEDTGTDGDDPAGGAGIGDWAGTGSDEAAGSDDGGGPGDGGEPGGGGVDSGGGTSDGGGAGEEGGAGDRLLLLVGIVLFGVLAFAFGVIVIGGMNPAWGEDAPEAEWELDRVNDTHVGIVHGGGDAVDARELTVTVGGRERRVSWSGEVGPGDRGVLRAGEGDIVRLYWTGGRGTRDLLEEWRL
jgi:hypothetical protein